MKTLNKILEATPFNMRCCHLWLLPVLGFFSLTTLNAQVTNYSFSQSAGTYTPVTGGTLLVAQTGNTTSTEAALDDAVVYTIPIPFTFTFDGSGYTSCTMTNNGSVSFGGTPIAANIYTPISGTGAYAAAIGAYARDLQGGFVFTGTRTLSSTTITAANNTDGVTIGSVISGTGIPAGTTVVSKTASTVEMSAAATSTSTATACWVWNGEMRYEVLGSVGSRVLVMQWSNMKPFGTTLTTVSGFRMNMQVRLYEANNFIEVVYGECSPGVVTSTATAQVGLRGPNNTFPANVNNRLNTKNVNDNWVNSVAGTSNASGMLFNNASPANVIATGLTYRWEPPAPCAGTPMPGNTTGPSLACSGVNFTLGLTNATSGTGVSYQWYSSTISASGPWTPVGANAATFTTSQTQQTWYYCAVTCATGPNTGSSNVLQVNMDAVVNCYCNTINFTSNVEPICLVQFAGINNSTCSALNCSPALENFTAGTPANVMPGQMYSITVSGNTDGNFTNHFRVFFDWDQDGVFEASEVIGTILNTNCVAQATTNITIPMNALVGTTRMRVVKNFNTSPTNPCSTYSFGQAEDYTVIVTAPIPPCEAPGAPSASGVGATSATVSWAAAPGATSYDWTVGTGASCPTGSGANTAATSVNLTGLIPNTTYRFCVRTSTCGGGSATSYMSTTFTTGPLPNDLCSGAQVVTCGSTTTGSTVGATSDAAVGSCGIGTGGTPGNGVWYKLVGNGAQVTASLCGSAYDTKLHVYTGTCGSLTCLVSNDDNAAACGAGSTRSQVIFNANVGTDYYILVSGFSSNTGTFSLNLTCLCGPAIGAPWTTTGVGGATGSAIDNVCENTLDVASNGFSPSLSADMMNFIHQNLCGNQSVTVKVNNITNGGWAGIMFRESTAAGAKMVAIKTQLNTHVTREVRTTANGPRSTQQIPAIGHTWLRLVRNGNIFTGFQSHNGVVWQTAFTVTVAMNSCLEVGLFTQGINVNSVATASFSNVSGIPTTIIPLVGVGGVQLDIAPLEFSLFPNPTQSEINVKMGEEFMGKDVTVQIMNQLGQTVMVRRLNEVQNPVENIRLDNFAEGIYFLTLRTEGQEALTKKFIVKGLRP